MAHDPSREHKVWNPCPHSHGSFPLNNHHFYHDRGHHHHHLHHHHHIHSFPLCPLHHHHHIHSFPLCPLHHHHFHYHCLIAHKFTPASAQIREPMRTDFPIQNNSIIGHSGRGQADVSSSLMLQEQEFEEPEDEDDEPIFVLTDEWREFFAKSEARRQPSKKKQGKKGKS